MHLKKLNLSVISKLVLLVLFFTTRLSYGQSPVISVNIGSGKTTNTDIYENTKIMSLLSSRFSGSQRNFTINGIITLSITTIGSTCGSNNGSIIATASGGTAPYLFSLSNGLVRNTGYFTRISPGTYTLTVTDATGETATSSITVSNTFSHPSLSVSSYTRVSACAAHDASVTLSATGGTPPYQYSMDGSNFQASNIFTNLYAGIYIFFVKDANGCIATFNTFNLGHLLSNSCNTGGIGVSYSAFVCGNEGSITASSTGNQYIYSLDGINYQSTPDFLNLTSGVYILYYKNAAGQIVTFQVVLFQYCDISIDYISVDAACQQGDGSITVDAINGATPYTYTIDGINFQSSNVFTGLWAGSYSVTVRDANGTTNSLTAVVHDRCPVISLTATGETCVHNDGTITATATKGTAPYQYSIDGVNFQTNNVFTGLSIGTYSVILKDALGFTDTATISVNNACLVVNATGTNSTCGNNNASITANASIGTAPYQYSIDGINFQAGNTFAGLAAGTYTVTAKDANSRIGTTTLTLSNSPGPIINAVTSPAFCSNDNGSIVITGTGGTSPLQFSINGTTYFNNGNFNGLSSGSYTAWIKDANGCLASQAVNISVNCPVVTAVSTDETCGSSNGSVTATGSSGTAPYEYSIDGVNFQSSNVFSGLSSGTYTVTIKDALGATNTVDVNLSNICPTVSVTVTNGLCGTANASLVATGANGTPPYQYSIDGINFQNNNSFTGLVSGTYTVTVKDANGLTNTNSADVQNFPGPQMIVSSVPASCLDTDGSINITATGGADPLQYSIDGTNYQNNNVFNGIASGSYTVWTKDVNGCPASGTISVIVIDDLTLDAGNDITICEGTNTVFAATSNGTGFNWTPSVDLNTAGQLNPVASPSADTKFYITAVLGVCTKTDSLTVFVNPAPLANAGENATICFGQSLQLAGSGGNVYEWTPSTYLDDAHINNPFVQNPANTLTYNLQVTDGNGCRSLQNSSVTITVTPPAKVFAGNDTSIVMNQPFTLKATDINNSGFTQYTWSPPFGLNNDNIQNPVAVLDREMTYTLVATTDAGCQGTDEINIKAYKGPEIYVPSAFSPNNDGRNDVLRAIPVGIKEFRYFVLYNRWGQRIFYTADPSKGWDGRIEATNQGNDTFIWMAEGIDDKGNKIQRKGTVTIIR